MKCIQHCYFYNSSKKTEDLSVPETSRGSQGQAGSQVKTNSLNRLSLKPAASRFQQTPASSASTLLVLL